MKSLDVEVKPHKIYDRYGATHDGRVVKLNVKYLTSKKEANIVKQRSKSQVQLYMDGKRASMSVGKFIYECWVGEVPDGMYVDYEDGDRQNRCVDNLVLSKIGSGSGAGGRRSSLTAEQIKEVKMRFELGDAPMDIATALGISYNVVWGTLNSSRLA